MKVGTDGVLLGAWVKPLFAPKTILDIGTGTGLIAIMMAQRFKDALIDAIEIDEETTHEAILNMQSSLWADRLSANHCSLKNFKATKLYDLVICNPPFFRNTTISKDYKKALARNNKSLSLEYLLNKSSDLLSENGEIAIIIPNNELKAIKNQAKISKLHINQICNVRGHEKSKIKRALIMLGKNEQTKHEEHLSIEKSRHNYTKKYKNLCKDFYLKF